MNLEPDNDTFVSIRTAVTYPLSLGPVAIIRPIKLVEGTYGAPIYNISADETTNHDGILKSYDKFSHNSIPSIECSPRTAYFCCSSNKSSDMSRSTAIFSLTRANWLFNEPRSWLPYHIDVGATLCRRYRHFCVRGIIMNPHVHNNDRIII